MPTLLDTCLILIKSLNDVVPSPSHPTAFFSRFSSDPKLLSLNISLHIHFISLHTCIFLASSLGYSYLPPMEAMQITPSKYLAAKLVQNSGINCFRQLGFASFSSGKRKDRSFCIRARSYKEEGEFVSRGSGNAKNQETKEGVLVGDEIGSVVGFRFIPNSGQNHYCCDTKL